MRNVSLRLTTSHVISMTVNGDFKAVNLQTEILRDECAFLNLHLSCDFLRKGTNSIRILHFHYGS